MAEQTAAERIKQRRYQMMVHSYLYYEKNVNIVSDSKWSQWAMELVDLQRKYPEESKRTEFYQEFKDWDGSSGAFLKFPEKIKNRAEILYAQHSKPVIRKKPKVVGKKTTGARKLF